MAAEEGITVDYETRDARLELEVVVADDPVLAAARKYGGADKDEAESDWEHLSVGELSTVKALTETLDGIARRTNAAKAWCYSDGWDALLKTLGLHAPLPERVRWPRPRPSHHHGDASADRADR
jgi:hypothetical protein